MVTPFIVRVGEFTSNTWKDEVGSNPTLITLGFGRVPESID